MSIWLKKCSFTLFFLCVLQQTCAMEYGYVDLEKNKQLKEMVWEIYDNSQFTEANVDQIGNLIKQGADSNIFCNVTPLYILIAAYINTSDFTEFDQKVAEWRHYGLAFNLLVDNYRGVVDHVYYNKFHPEKKHELLKILVKHGLDVRDLIHGRATVLCAAAAGSLKAIKLVRMSKNFFYVDGVGDNIVHDIIYNNSIENAKYVNGRELRIGNFIRYAFFDYEKEKNPAIVNNNVEQMEVVCGSVNKLIEMLRAKNKQKKTPLDMVCAKYKQKNADILNPVVWEDDLKKFTAVFSEKHTFAGLGPIVKNNLVYEYLLANKESELPSCK